MSIQRKRDEAEWKSNFDRLVSDPNARSTEKVKQWIYRQRRLHTLGKLSKDKVQLLETHGYRMTSTNPLCGKGMKSGKRDEKWNEKFKRLQEYRNANGNVDIPFRYPADQSLANWVVAQRCRSRETDKDGNPLMDQERVNKLNSIGFIWSKH